MLLLLLGNVGDVVGGLLVLGVGGKILGEGSCLDVLLSLVKGVLLLTVVVSLASRTFNRQSRMRLAWLRLAEMVLARMRLSCELTSAELWCMQLLDILRKLLGLRATGQVLVVGSSGPRRVVEGVERL